MNNITTIVTCFFKINSKHSYENYQLWMTNMLENIETSMYIYCDQDSVDFIKEKRKHYLDKTRFKVLKFEDFYTYKYYDKFVEHHSIDPEKHIHNPYLYMIWAEKTNFLKLSKDENYFNSDFFLWCDIGCFRNRIDKQDIPIDQIKNFPNPEKIRLIPDNKIIFTQTGEIHPDLTKLDDNGLTLIPFTYVKASIGGTMFGCKKKFVDTWFNLYHEMLELFFKNNRFAGKDQNIYANICVKHRNKVILFMPLKGDPWFYFHWLLN